VAPERQGRAMLRRGALCGKRVFSLTPKIRAAAQRRPTVIQISEYKNRGNREIREVCEPGKLAGGRVCFFRVFRVFRGSKNFLGEDLGAFWRLVCGNG
jgi:hypothetical protein